jgi:uncharacterized protein (TIGR03435 family)
MWKIIPASFAVLLCLVPLRAADVSGTWTGAPFYVILKQDGNKLIGSGGPTKAEQYAFDNGSVDGDRITLNLGPLTLDLRITGDEIRGQAKAGDQTMPVYMKRLAVRPPGAPPPEFEAASVKRAVPPAGGRFNPSMKLSPGRFTCTSMPLWNLLLRAYDLKEYQLSGPDWLRSEFYDVNATMPPSTSTEDMQLMLQSLLNDRFKVVARRETKELPVYGLVVAKSGSKLKEVPLAFGRSSFARGAFHAPSIDMPRLAQMLSTSVDRPVIDMTGLKGFFEIKLDWTPDDTRRPQGDGADAGGPPVGPSIYTAVQEQLGLTLSPRKAPIELLIVDRAEKIPGEN